MCSEFWGLIDRTNRTIFVFFTARGDSSRHISASRERPAKSRLFFMGSEKKGFIHMRSAIISVALHTQTGVRCRLPPFRRSEENACLVEADKIHRCAKDGVPMVLSIIFSNITLTFRVKRTARVGRKCYESCRSAKYDGAQFACNDGFVFWATFAGSNPS